MKAMMNCMQRVKRIYAKISKEQWIIIVQVLLLVSICILHAFSAGEYADFYPINGTFQNYNPIRRFLDGQIPYRDFTDYLGLGHLYVGTFFTYIMGGNYRASLIAFSLLTILSFALLSIVLGKVIMGNWRKSILLTNQIIFILILFQSIYWNSVFAGTGGIFDALNMALITGNAARFVRGLVLSICCLVFLAGLWLYHTLIKRWPWMIEKRVYIGTVGAGCIAGPVCAWSNDFGISCFLCLGIMTFLVLIAKRAKAVHIFIGICLEIISSLAFLFIWVEIFTIGHFEEWFSATFGTGGYQSWYYLSEKNYYVYDVDVSFWVFAQAALCLVYLYKLFREHGNARAIVRYGIPAFANMVCFCAVNEYHLLSGGNALEVALSVLFFSCLYEGTNYLGQIVPGENVHNLLEKASIFFLFVWFVSTMKDEIVTNKFTDKSGQYVEALGGNMTSYYEDLENAQQFLNGEKFFATYASALEVIEDTYQPSGFDYIIHVLGDEQRENYLNAFATEDFRYAVTIRDTFTNWEYWCQRANWFFYRELYQNWHPVYANSYELFWERNEEVDEYTYSGDYQVSIVDVDEATKKIVVQTDTSVDGIADVYVDYLVSKDESMHSYLTFQTMLKVKNTGKCYSGNNYYETNYLRPEGAEYIPVTIVNGYGEVTLTSCPAQNTYLEIYNISCSNIYTAGYRFIEISKTMVEEDTEKIVLIPNTPKNQDVIADSKGIWIRDIQALFVEKREDDSYLYLTLDVNSAEWDESVAVLDGNNMVQLIKD